MPRMSRAQSLPAPVGLLPLPRPLMTGEVLDAAFRLFRAGLVRCLPYSGLAALVLQLPDLRATYFPAGWLGSSSDRYVLPACSMLIGVLLFGVLTLRLHAISRGERPRFRREVFNALKRWPAAVIASAGSLAFAAALVAVGTMFNPFTPNPLGLLGVLVLVWPAALFVVGLPAFWCDGLNPFSAVFRAVRISWRRLWRMVGVVLAVTCIVIVFYICAAIIVGLVSQLMRRADLVLLTAMRSMNSLVMGTLGVPFVLATLIVAYEDLKFRDLERRGAAA
jgi:hypothetical protein